MRVRRASFFPREERTSAVTVISFLTLLSPQRVRSPFTLVAPAVLPPVFSRFSWVRYPAIFLHKQRTHRSLLMNRPDGIRHQPGDRQRFDPAAPPRLFRKRNRIRTNHFRQLGFDSFFGRG